MDGWANWFYREPATLIRLGTLLGILAVFASADAAYAAAPPNDDFEDAQALTTGVAAVGSNEEASTQDGEPVHSTWVAPANSVWFTWTAPETGLARISSCGSDFDSVVAVYGGSTLSGIYATRLANDDDGCGPTAYAAVTYLRVQAGTTYRIALTGWTFSDSGNYQLVAEMLGDPGPPPANDAPGAAATLSGASVTATGTNAGATSGWNEWPPGATQAVWWRWVSPVSGQVRVDTCDSDFSTVLGVREGQDGQVAGDWADNRCDDRGAVIVNAVAGQEYWIAVGGDRGASGSISLSIDATADVTAPVTTFTSGPSGEWGRRLATFAWTVEDEGSTTSECSVDDGEWYLCGSSEDLYSLDEGDHSFAVRSIDQHGNQESPGARSDFTVVIPEAPNDDFADAAALAPGVPITVNNGKASAETGERSHDSWYYERGGLANWSVWFKFTPTTDSVAHLDWCATGFELATAVYTGSDVAALTRVDQEDEDCELAVQVTAGVTYRVAIDGFARSHDYGTGPISLVADYEASAEPPAPTGGSTPEPPPPPGGADEPGAEALLRVVGERPLRAAVDDGGRFAVSRVRVHCRPGAACTVAVKVLARRGSRRLGGNTFRLDPGRKTVLRARLNRATRRMLRRRGRIGVRLQVALPGGGSRTLPVTLASAASRR
jgi:hypothetical protein